MEIKFKNLVFEVLDGKIQISRIGELILTGGTIAEIHIAGEDKPQNFGAKLGNSSEGEKLLYSYHEEKNDSLIICQSSTLLRARTVFTAFENTQTIQVHTQIENISQTDIFVEEVSAFMLSGFSKMKKSDNLYFTCFKQSHQTECQPYRKSFSGWGLFNGQANGQKRLSFANVGSWSTKEELPQGIIELDDGNDIMFQIESSNSWYYEIGEKNGNYYLYLGGGNLPFGGWTKKLSPNQAYETPSIAIAVSSAVNGLLAEMTKYRREISKNNLEKSLPTVFNEYMHLSWDSPTEGNTAKIAPIVGKLGIDYYVIDCGWHNEEDGNIIYPYVGQWKESHARFPNGLRKITDFIHDLGMKVGLWMEPEIIGIKCAEMLDYYDDSCFVLRNGKKVSVAGRYFLDYRNEKVVDYMTKSIARMVEEYGADYIKFDYNQDMGVGTEQNCDSFGEGLELVNQAFFSWVEKIKQKYPNVIFECCASGGMRLDYNTLKRYALASTSDQTNYLKYPYIAGNILSAVLPEQAAVWAYPVAGDDEMTEEKVVFNMINSLLGRIHLASSLDKLSDTQLALVKEGIDCYKEIVESKKGSVPYLPLGFCNFGDEKVVSGFRKGTEIYLAVWNLKEDSQKIEIPIQEQISKCEIIYPKKCNQNVQFYLEKNNLVVSYTQGKTARFFKLIVKE